MTIAEMLKQHGREQGREEGREEGSLVAKRETALNMLKLGSDVEFICKVTGLSAEDVAQLAKDIPFSH